MKEDAGSDVVRSNKVRDTSWAIGVGSINQLSKEKLRPCAHTLTVGTWNVRTMWAPGKLELLENEMEKYRFDILGLAKMRWTASKEMHGCKVIWSCVAELKLTFPFSRLSATLYALLIPSWLSLAMSLRFLNCALCFFFSLILIFAITRLWSESMSLPVTIDNVWFFPDTVYCG